MTLLSWTTVVISLLITPVAMADENPHCVSSDDGYSVITMQCDDGVVTITNRSTGSAIVCIAEPGYGTECKAVKL
ncbi:hypothetical protein DPO11_20475 [Salmonella enterica]|nr:hypothetical protein [Salmonella enterica]